MDYRRKISTLSHWLTRRGFQAEALRVVSMQDESLGEDYEVDTSGNNTVFKVDGGRLMIMENSKWAQGAHSVIDFVVDKDKRGLGIGTKLVRAIVDYYSGQHISAQVSSVASLKVFMNFGFRVTLAPKASFEEAEVILKQEGGSLNLRINDPEMDGLR